MTSDQIELRDEDRLPWLETVEPDEERGGDWPRVIGFVLLGLALLAAIVFGAMKLSSRPPADGGGATIAAQPGDYKVKPDDPGGLKVSGEGDSAIATSAGAGSGNGAIDLKAVPETPVAARHGAVQPAPLPAGAGRTVADVPASGGKLTAAAPPSAPRAGVPGAASGGALVQLGAFPSEAAANAAWSAMAKRFGYVATLGKSVEQAQVGGRSVYRLRVDAGSANAAADVCGRLKVAGESCFVTSG